MKLLVKSDAAAITDQVFYNLNILKKYASFM